MKKRRINHNDLVPWFTKDHKLLPASYVKSCKEFFEWLEQCNKEGFKAPSIKPKQRGLTKKEERLGWITRGHEPQASGSKPQASSDKLPQRQTKKDI